MRMFISIFVLLLTSSSFSQWTKKANLGGVGRHRGTGISIGNKGYIGLGHTNGTGVNIDFKDWWQNSKDEWPEIAAAVITNLREREELAWQQLEEFRDEMFRREMNET